MGILGQVRSAKTLKTIYMNLQYVKPKRLISCFQKSNTSMNMTLLQSVLREPTWKCRSNGEHFRKTENLVLHLLQWKYFEIVSLWFVTVALKKQNTHKMSFYTFYTGDQVVDFPSKLSKHCRSWVKANKILSLLS